MSVTHHPPPELLAGFAAGTLDAGEHLAIAVHVSGCPACRRLVRAVEGIGGSTLETIEPAPMKAGAFEAVVAKLDDPRLNPLRPPSFTDDELPNPEALSHWKAPTGRPGRQHAAHRIAGPVEIARIPAPIEPRYAHARAYPYRD